jgi:hypothetical protein
MNTSKPSTKSYKFNFIKDRFWIWAVVFPFGLIGWAIPFMLFFGLINTENSPGWFPAFGFLLLGISGYLIGWIFVYSLMEGIFTKVTIAQDWITIKLPWLIFPLIPIEKKINLANVHRVNPFASYGSRTAVFLYYYKNNKEQHLTIPKFKYNHAYLEEIDAIKKQIDASHSPLPAVKDTHTGGMPSKAEILQRSMSTYNLPLSFPERILHWLYFLVLIGVFTLSCMISNTLSMDNGESLAIGFNLAFAISILGFLGLVPGIGQIVIWYSGHWLITTFALFFFRIDTDAILWHTPGWVNQFLAQFHIQPIQASYTNILFASILLFSILISVDRTIGWLRRRTYQQQLERSGKLAYSS